MAQKGLPEIRIDQEGYYPGAPKIAVLTDYSRYPSAFPPDNTPFFLLRENSSDTVFRGILGSLRHSKNSMQITRIADFSAVRDTGTFRIVVAGSNQSYAFAIRNNVHRPIALSTLKAFYFMRVSEVLEPRYAGPWSRPVGHPDNQVLIHPSAVSSTRKAGDTISTPGGWYDAGDYNKYIVNSGITTGTLLSAYADYSAYFDTLHTNIPALSKPIPDILNEILVNLRWMLTMQDPQDGGVYNKCTNARFDSMWMPDACTHPRYVVQKGTAATLDFAAVTAQAARIFSAFKKELPGLSDSCLAAAEKAWAWALVNPAMVYDQNAMNRIYEPKITTGPYGDQYLTDEWFWAATELSITTNSKKYRDTLAKYINSPFGLPTWSNTGLLGYYSLIRHPGKYLTRSEEDSLRARLVSMAEDYLAAAANNAFATVMGGRKKDFNWGSNANAGNQGILLMQVYRITGNRKYLDAALGNLEYICGRNATGYCFITGSGSFSTRHPHHRPSIADGVDDPVPGMLAAGPNPGMQDKCYYEFTEAETAYSDTDCAYASNEIAINWNAPLVYLVNAIEAEQKQFRNAK